MSVDLRFGATDIAGDNLLIGWTDMGIAAISSGALDGFLASLERRFRTRPAPGRMPGPTARWLAAALRGSADEVPAVDLGGLSTFDAAVYRAVREVPRGATVTYGDIGREIGMPRAARAVGGALSRCPLFPAVPCHRVVRAADGWSGWGGDVAAKRKLLDLERGMAYPAGT
jgi:methylated-DNA-[protein]-cysteine S-methyltransferase